MKYDIDFCLLKHSTNYPRRVNYSLLEISGEKELKEKLTLSETSKSIF